MPRLNIKSTKAAFVKELKKIERFASNSPEPATKKFYTSQQAVLLNVAQELEIEIKESEYKCQ